MRERVLVVGGTAMQAQDYIRVMSYRHEHFHEDARVVSHVNDLRSCKPGTKCHLVGTFWERPDFREMQESIRMRGFVVTEVMDWR